MPTWKSLLHPRMRDEKRRGDWAEAAFTAKALGQGLTVCKPVGENDPFDFVVFNIRRSVNRVQVKSAWKRWRGKYTISVPLYAGMTKRSAAFSYAEWSRCVR